MKKHFYVMAVAMMLVITSFTNRVFAEDHLATDKTTAANTERMEQIKSRLEEIKHMDKSALTHEERKALRHEVKAMRGEVTEVRAHGGIYLSIGAVLIIILILILVL